MADTILLTEAKAIQALFQGLQLPTLQNNQVLIKEFPTFREADGIAQPVNAVIISKPQMPEQEVGSLTGADDWAFGLLVTHARASNQSNQWDDVGQGWRESLMFSLHNKRLPGVPNVLKCLVTPVVPLDSAAWHDLNASVGQFLVRPIYRRVRT